MTLEEFIQNKINDIRLKALSKSLTRLVPRVPIIGGTKNPETYELFNERKANILKNLNNQLKNMEVSKSNPYYNMFNMINENNYKDIIKRKDELEKSQYLPNIGGYIGPSCIYTATDNYGEQYLNCSNKDFINKVGKNGFKEVPIKNVKPGDIVIRTEGDNNHGMIFDSYDNNGTRLYNHSNGGNTEEAIRKKAKYPATENLLRAFTFTGTPLDSIQWKKQYKYLNK